MCTVQHKPLQLTHRNVGTLDLVIKKGEQVDEMTVDPDIISDHSIISWRLTLDRQPQIVHYHEVRQCNKMNKDAFHAALIDSELYSSNHRPDSVGEYCDKYHSILQNLANQFAPVKRVTIRHQRQALWFDDECRSPLPSRQGIIYRPISAKGLTMHLILITI